ncbi:hypothetical protein H6F32_18835 [Anabaena sp. FACHB-1237]|uniref:COP23 domain-containing protein n=1 Tax=Anabaena sp. FACHB-1237 TaxID=2692769 RepID=UPI001680C9FB|nr:COP23 domain-containing protein [Anabaena sp. FACHB-1237]MBD2139564.1 hypothetical protein [Anabaena sp. FACHB-1237]
MKLSLPLLSLSSLGLSLLLSSFTVSAQVVVPTIPSGSSTTVPTGSTTVPTGSTANNSTRFSCQFYNGKHTVMYQPQSRPGQYFAWAAPQALGGGWDTQKRCEAIASRLELYRPDGLQELQIAAENRENIICVTTQTVPSCRILLTVPRGKDPYAVRSSVFDNLAAADNGQETIAVNTYGNRNPGGVQGIYNIGQSVLGGNNRVSNSRSGINLKPYLDPKDGGTGSNLKNGAVIRSNNRNVQPIRLNPGLFR